MANKAFASNIVVALPQNVSVSRSRLIFNGEPSAEAICKRVETVEAGQRKKRKV
jgi:hypothetical protein